MKEQENQVGGQLHQKLNKHQNPPGKPPPPPFPAVYWPAFYLRLRYTTARSIE